MGASFVVVDAIGWLLILELVIVALVFGAIAIDSSHHRGWLRRIATRLPVRLRTWAIRAGDVLMPIPTWHVAGAHGLPPVDGHPGSFDIFLSSSDELPTARPSAARCVPFRTPAVEPSAPWPRSIAAVPVESKLSPTDTSESSASPSPSAVLTAAIYVDAIARNLHHASVLMTLGPAAAGQLVPFDTLAPHAQQHFRDEAEVLVRKQDPWHHAAAIGAAERVCGGGFSRGMTAYAYALRHPAPPAPTSSTAAGRRA